MIDVLSYLDEHALSLQQKTIQHISLTVISVIFASCIAIPLGIWIQRIAYFRNSILKVGSVTQTIPSLALLAFLVPFLGLGTTPTLVVLTFYAVYPILQSTFTGLNNVPSECIEAADGLGFSTYYKLRYVELPLALPVIISGLRVATAMTIGIATIAAFIGAGGLGDFIMQGLSLNDSSLILLGAIPAAILALIFDFGISQLEKQFHKRGAERKYLRRVLLALVSLVILFALGDSIFKEIASRRSDTIVISSKNFTEQNILAEIMAQLIEEKTNLKVIRKFNLGSTAIVHLAMLNGEIDLYPEYSGSAYMTILKKQMKDQSKDSDIFQDVRSEYKKRFNLIWLEPFGFSNSQSLAIKKDFARENHISSMSDLAIIADKLSISAPPEFIYRPDALPGLSRVYGFKFKKIMQVDPNLMYAAIDNKKVDVIAAFTTDGRLLKHDLITLKDDKKLYPPYMAAAVIRAPILEAHPQVYEALKPLFGSLTNEKMMTLNYQVQSEGLSPEAVARTFIKELK